MNKKKGEYRIALRIQNEPIRFAIRTFFPQIFDLKTQTDTRIQSNIGWRKQRISATCINYGSVNKKEKTNTCHNMKKWLCLEKMTLDQTNESAL